MLQGATLPLLIRRLRLSSPEDEAYETAETSKAERVAHDAANEVLVRFDDDPPAWADATTLANIRRTIARQSRAAEEVPDLQARTRSAEVYLALYRRVLAAQRAALIAERGAGHIEDEAVRAMLERLDLQETGVTARLESRL